MRIVQALSRLKLNILYELKGMKLYWMQILISLFVMPISFVFVFLIGGGSDGEKVAFWLSGFIVASMGGAFLGTVALRVCNLMAPEVRELYATFALSRGEMVMSVSVTYTLLVLPQILIAGSIAAFMAPAFHIWLFIFAILGGMLSLATLSVWLGLLVKNYYHALGLFPLLSWIIILLSPAYYDPVQLNPAFRWGLLLNPLTHYLNLIRTGLGFTPALAPLWSLLYTLGLFTFILVAIRRRLGGMYILEKF